MLKFCTCDYANKEAAQHELEVGRRLASANLSHKGILYLQTVVEGFEVAGPNGMHVCLVFEPMRENLSLFQSRLKQKRFSLELMKMYLVCLSQQPPIWACPPFGHLLIKFFNKIK